MKVDASAVERRSRVHAVLNHVSIRVKLGGIAALLPVLPLATSQDFSGCGEKFYWMLGW